MTNEQESIFSPDRLIEAIERGGAILDGAMSPQTQMLLHQFGVSHVDMTIWWVRTPQSWSCPACGRPKAELVRVNKNGELMCRLVEHHDHMADVLERKFREHSIARDHVVADDIAQEFATRSATMVSAYDGTIICNDCNNADPKAKAMVGAPADFSFSPAEIRQFVSAQANRDHGINAEEAKRLWEDCRPSFELRMKIIDRIASIAANNEHWFQRSHLDARPDTIEQRATISARHFNYFGDLGVLCGTKRAVPPEASAWRKVRRPQPKGKPSPQEIEHIAKVSHKKRWDLVENDWVCPGCNRSKWHIIRRRSRDNRWAFPLESLLLYNSDAKNNRKSCYLCADCADAAKFLGKEAVLLAGTNHGTYANHVGLRDLSAMIRPQKYGYHNFDLNAVEAVLHRIVERLLADEEPSFYWADDGQGLR